MKLKLKNHKGKNTLLCTNLCGLRCLIKGFKPEIFSYVSVKLPLSQKLH